MAKGEIETQKSSADLTKLGFSVKVIENLHTKAVIGDVLMYQGSANITYSGLYSNIESVTLMAINNQEEVLRRVFTQ